MDFGTTTWIEGPWSPAMWNHFGNDGHRTNYNLGGFHHKINRIAAKKHPNIYEVVGLLKREQSVTEVKVQQLQGHGREPPHKKKYRAIDARLRSPMQNLISQTLNVLLQEKDIFNYSEIYNWTQDLNISSGNHNTTGSRFNITVLSDDVVGNVFSKWRTTTPSVNTLTVAFRGRLGNNMFEYASLLGIAVSTGKQPFISKSNLLNGLFNISFIADKRNHSSIRVSEKQYGAYDHKLLTLPDGNVEILGYLQSWKYFHSIGDSIRKEFVFRRKYIDLSRQCLEKYTSKHSNRTVVGIHVRRTDMVSGRKSGYVPAPLSYIQKAVAHMKTKFHNPLFLIATDDKNWCRQNVVSPDIILMENSDPFVDFATLTLCDHMIMTVGTYGWWAAWLGNGYAVYYRDFPRPGSVLARNLIKEDHFLPHWVPLDA
ncbi:galactoside alpha-(1,2)-fucosyltransferase 2-like [Haliotis asinina]|uniref:galactoside alpha-(1,2)-fucosyltransferase 2-like n=1 Tax=Haliotis asinina TaxID=109174 RepID=UPI0035318452